MPRQKHTYKLRLSGIVLASIISAACVDSTPEIDDGQDEVDVILTGSIGDGPIIGATVSILDNQGRVLRSETSSTNATYRIRLKARRASYPLVIEASGGTDMVTGAAPDFLLRSVASAPADTRVNVNPYTTLIAGLAESLPGGLIPANVDSAEEIVLDTLNFGLDSSLVESPIATPITEANAASMIKSSEALGEMLRRVRNAMDGTKNSINVDQVLLTIASDLIDGILDGVGGTAADPRIAALATVASAEVLIEYLRNELAVGQESATSALDAAIRSSFPGIVDTSPTEMVATTEAALAQTTIALIAARSVTEADLDTLLAQLATIPAGALPATVRARLTYQPGDAFANTLAAVSQGTAEQLESVNATVRAGGDASHSEPNPSEPRLMFSMNSDLSDASPLAGATLSGQVQFFLTVPEEWRERGVEKVIFYCCKGAGDAHAQYPGDTTEPYSITVDLAQYAAGTERELYADVVLSDQYAPEYLSVNFTVGSSDPAEPSDPTDPAATATATLSWTPPTTNSDGSWLTDLAGYKIYYGTTSGEYTEVLDVPVTVTEFTVDNLSPNTYYFVMTAYNTQGLESSYSNVASKKIE